MPELPEVETVARQLAPLIEGRTWQELEILDTRRLKPGSIPAGAWHVTKVYRVGKRVAIALARHGKAKPEHWLCVHLRMTGRLIWQPARRSSHGHNLTPPEPDRPAQPAPAQKALRACIRLGGGSVLFYDTRRFGTLQFYDAPPEDSEPGVDPLSRALTVKRLAELLGMSRTPLKLWLLKQDKLVGIGNIYASEILFAAGLHPQRPAGSLSQADVKGLLKAIRDVLRKAIKHCGTTFSDFQDANGESGGFLRFLKVYGRAGQPCRHCGTAIKRLAQGQRSTFYCPHCQPAE